MEGLIASALYNFRIGFQNLSWNRSPDFVTEASAKTLAFEPSAWGVEVDELKIGPQQPQALLFAGRPSFLIL